MSPSPLESNHTLMDSAPFSASFGLLSTGDVPAKWFARMRNLSGSFQDYLVYAVCSASSDATAKFTSFVTSPGAGAGEGSTTVDCPAGQRAIGGGVTDQTGSPIAIEASLPLDADGSVAGLADGDVPTKWFVDVRADQHQMAAYAICSANSRATIQVEGTNLQSMTHPDLTAQCPTTTRVLSGGAGTSATDASGAIESSAPTNASGETLPSAGGVGSGWSVRIGALAPGPRPYKVAAVCEGATGSQPPGGGGGGGVSNEFTIGKLTRNKAKGTARLAVSVPGAGELELQSPRLKRRAIDVAGAGDVQLKIKATGKAKRKLRRQGKVRFVAQVTYTPTGGASASQVERGKLKRAR